MATELQLKRPGVLTVAAYTGFFPVCYTRGRRVCGSDADIIERFAESLGLDVEYVQVEAFSDAYRLLDGADVGIGGIAMTPDRLSDGVVWSAPYAVVKRTLVYNVDAPVRRFPEDVAFTVAATAGSTGHSDGLARLRAVGKEHLLRHEHLLRNEHLLRHEHPRDRSAIRQLLDGSIQGLLRGCVSGRALVRQFPEQLGMTEPWEMGDAPEAFRFPCRLEGGVEPLLSAFLARSPH